eukprot:scaffold40624_cov29-Prasinocladus_malaysianus.AAC.1
MTLTTLHKSIMYFIRTELFSGDGTKRRALGRLVAPDDSAGPARIGGPRVYAGGGKSKAVKKLL